MTAPADTMTLTAACGIAGITYRQADYWCRMGYLPDVEQHIGSGHNRSVTRTQLAHLMRLARLVKAGLDVAVAAPALAAAAPDAIAIPLATGVYVVLT